MEALDDDAPPELVVTAAATNHGDNSQADNEVTLPKVPLTIVTGYLGSGKTTLVDYILKEQHGKKIAVILNEFGDSTDVEKPLTIQDADGPPVIDFLTLGNGCICCSVKDAGVNAIEALMSKDVEMQQNKPGQGKTAVRPFDYILLETSGLADPGNLVPLFWVDDGLGSTLYLDGVVCVVDAANIFRSLDEPNLEEAVSREKDSDDVASPPPVQDEKRLETVAHRQISGADVILVNKCDKLSPEQIELVDARIRAINGLAKLHHTQYSRIPHLESILLDLHAYDQVSSADVSRVSPHNHLDPTIQTIALSMPVLNDDGLDRLNRWLQCLLWDRRLPVTSSSANASPRSLQAASWQGEIYRLKARIVVTNGRIKYIQGVREVFDIVDSTQDDHASVAEPEGANNDTTNAIKGLTLENASKMVLIGRELDKDIFAANLLAFLHVK